MVMGTKAYELRDKACKLYSAIEEENPEEIGNRSKEFLDYLNSEKTQRYLEGWGKLACGMGRVCLKKEWFENFTNVLSYKNGVLTTLSIIRRLGESRPKLSRKLQDDLLMLSSALAVMDIHEEEIEEAYASA